VPRGPHVPSQATCATCPRTSRSSRARATLSGSSSLDPAYLSWRVRKGHAHEVRFVELPLAVNSKMPRHVVDRITLLLNEPGKAVRAARILGSGIAHQAGTNETRESAGLKVLAGWQQLGAKVSYHDPLVASARVGGRDLRSAPLTTRTVQAQDRVVALAPQQEIDWNLVLRDSEVLFDSCNALGRSRTKVVRL
jgi:UDP-N-acetyl-D-glucosamine dehydrogenase